MREFFSEGIEAQNSKVNLPICDTDELYLVREVIFALIRSLALELAEGKKGIP